MKKINIVFLSMLTVLLSGVLMACTFKKPEANFNQEEIVLSVGQTVDLDQFLSVKEVDKANLEIVIAKSDMFEVEGHKVKGVKSGKSNAYAFYQKNILSSINLVVRKSFDSPTQFQFSEDGIISWNVPVTYFENDSSIPQEYLVKGTRTVYSSENPEVVENVYEVSETVQTNSLSLQELGAGVYNLTVSAKEYGYFAESAPSQPQTFYFGYMDNVELSWNSQTGELSWTEAAEALYRVKLDGVLLDDKQTENFKNLSQIMASKAAGTHILSVFVYDKNGKKLTKESESLTVEKLSVPAVSYSHSAKGGLLEITSSSSVDQYEILATNKESGQIETLTLQSDTTETNLPNLPFGLYDLQVVAVSNGNFYKSDAYTLENVYKLDKLNAVGLGGNLGDNFNVKISGQQSLFDTNVYASSLNCTETGLQTGENEKNVVLTVPQAGKFDISLVQKPELGHNTLSGEPVYVINSDESNVLQITKVCEFESDISHAYQNEKSVFSFSAVEGATTYRLMRFDGTEYVAVDVEPNMTDGVKFVLSGKIDELFDPVSKNGQSVYLFKVVAKTADDMLAINSEKEKEIGLLSAPTSANGGNSTEMTYNWNAALHANSYALEIYTVDKATFGASKDDENFQPSGEPLKEMANTTSYTFSQEGYYFVKIFAISGNEDQYISSKESLNEMFYIAKQLQMRGFVFGYDEDYKNYSGFTQASGYFVKVENVENANRFEIAVDDVANIFEIADENFNIYLFSENFTEAGKNYEVSAIARAEDETLYPHSEKAVISVSRLAPVVYDDLFIDKLTKTLTVEGRAGVSSILIWESDNNTASTTNENENAVFDISNLSNFTLKFNLFGSKAQNGLYDGNHIYLDSEQTIFNFTRLSNPTNLRYYDGELLMDHSAIAATDHYVLDLVCTTANSTTYKLTIRFKSTVTVEYNGQEFAIGNESQFISYSGTTVTMKISAIVGLIQANALLRQFYNQAKEISFCAYAYQKTETNGNVLLSSHYATTQQDITKTALSVAKMASPVLEFADNSTDYIFSWSAADENPVVEAQTSYKLTKNGEELSTPLGAMAANFSASEFEEGEYYDFKIVATNPNYLGEGVSNFVRIYRLRPVSRLTLMADGLGYTLSDPDFSDGVQVSVGGETSTVTTGKIEITQDGQYSLKVLGKTVENAGEKIYYIDSDAAVWTLREMAEIAPADTTLAFSNNLLSWNAFGEGKGLSSLKYLVMFKDVEGNIVSHTSNATSVNLQTDTGLNNAIQGLTAGQITISVSAFLDNYSVTAGGEIYFAQDVTLLDGATKNNHYVYQNDTTSKKLSTPKITNVEFVHTDLSDAQFPDVKVTFVGNYGDSGEFTIFLDDTVLRTVNLTQDNGEYVFTLSKEDYNNVVASGSSINVKVAAISSQDIPSSVGSVEIKRAYALKAIGLEEENGTYKHTLKVEFEEDYLDLTAGGVVLQIEHQSSTSGTQNRLLAVDSIAKELTFDLSDFFNEKFTSGGTITFAAFTNNFSSGGKYYLACPVVTESQTYSVLNSVSTVEKREGGFVIDSSLNGNNTKYIVSYGANQFVVNKANDFYFEIPDEWANGSYNLKLQAQEDGFVSSIVTDVEFVLNRIEKVTLVEMNRSSDLSDINLAWDAVPNASGYILRMYSQSGELLYKFDATRTSYTLAEIFGQRYASLLAYGKVSAFDLMQDLDVVFKLVTVGTDCNNSHVLSFNARILGNDMTEANLRLDAFGNLMFDSEVGQSYLYRFVGADGVSLSNWKQVDAQNVTTILDTSSLETGRQFNVEIVIMGSVNSTSAEYSFELDSVPLSTYGRDLTYILNDEIVQIGYKENVPSEMTITTIANSFNKLFVGLDEDSIISGNVVEIAPRHVEGSDIGVQTDYAYSFASLLDTMREEGWNVSINSDVELYFWSYRQTQIVSGSYVVSKPYKFVFNFKNEEAFNSIFKRGEIEGMTYAEDYANSYVLYTNSDNANLQTLGIYVKITQVDENFNSIKFVSKDELTSSEYDGVAEFGGKFVINLSRLFEEDDLVDLTGNFKVELSKLQISTEGGSTKYILTDWLSSAGAKEFEFERLKQVIALHLSSGNLYWQKQQEGGDRFYVYFMEDLDSANATYYPTTNLFFNASDFAGVEHTYYIAVQNLSEDPFQISSKLTFVQDGNVPAAIYKNQITSPLELKNGELSIAWKDGDFYQMLTSGGNWGELAAKLMSTTFTSPFTFTIKDLVDNNLTLSLRFTPLGLGAEGTRQTFNINAKNLLGSLIDFGQENNFDILGRLSLLESNANSTEDKSYIGKFKDFVQKGSYGIANKNILFDDYFERLQLGGYKLEYALIGNSKTLNSSWYAFKNANDENAFYVNGEPYTRVEKVESVDRAYNDYKVFVQKSDVFNFKNGQYGFETAGSYVLKIYDSAQLHAFVITKADSSYSLRLIGDDDQDRYVSVYECNASGELLEGGDYLVFYINHNAGDSLLGVYGDEIQKVSSFMQVYATGNDYSASSKSKFFKIAFLDFGAGLTINKGEFFWTSTINRATTIIYKKHTSSGDGMQIVEGTTATSKFSLNGLGDGLYDYIKFVLIGDVSDNSIYVDSEIYEIDNVYKLSSPTLSNDFGNIAINDSKNNYVLSNLCYSDVNPFNYILYNNISTSGSYIDFTDENMARSKLLYEPGSTGMTSSDEDYRYKSTENGASQFMVSSVGTTAKVVAEQDEGNYYIRKIYPVDINGNTVKDKSVGLRSNIATIDAKMMQTVSGMKIQDGVLSWEESSGEVTVGENVLHVPAANGSKVVYKVTVVQYKESTGANNSVTETNVGDPLYFYTTQNTFDFAQIREDQIVVSQEETYLKATVQALALQVGMIVPEDTVYKELIEGGFAYGNVLYEDSNVAILMSEGAIIKSIERVAPIKDDSLTVSDGKLQWQYTMGGVTKDTLLDYFTFIVTDAGDRQIDGTLEVEGEAGEFTITFTEKKGEIPDGIQTLKVYATQGKLNTAVTIKSFAREKEVTKLRTINADDVRITTNTENDAETLDLDTETLDLSKYFEDGNTNIVTLTAEFLTDGKVDSAKTQTFEFGKNGGVYKTKLYLLREEKDLTYSEDYVQGYLLIGEEQIVRLTYKVTTTAENFLYSDISDDFMLQRSDWGSGEISWNDTVQQFEWNYDGFYSLQESVSATVATKVKLTSRQVTLFLDENLTEPSAYTLASGTAVVVTETLDGVVKISYLDEEFFLDAADIQDGYSFGETEILPSGLTFKIIERGRDNSIICTNQDKLYQIQTNKIVTPIYIVEAVYGEEGSEIKRKYTTTDDFFKPTMIGKVGITVRIKLGTNNIQSKELSYQVGEEIAKATFDLFNGGDGTSTNPYIIANERQFKNMAYRQTKESALVQYIEVVEEQGGNVEKTSVITESVQYYFKLEEDIVLSEALSQVLFAGSFDGVIDGQGHTITYTAKETGLLSNPVTVSVGNVLGSEASDRSMTYSYGVALFENLTERSTVSNLNLDVSYAAETIGVVASTIPNDSLMAALAITNGGQIENVNLIGFSSNFTGYNSPGERIIMVYSGIASINLGNNAKISNCHVLTDMNLSDNAQSQLVFVSGVAFTNYATIENCTSGTQDDQLSISVECQSDTSTVQAAGIVVTNSGSATLRNCVNYANIKVACSKPVNYMTVYVAGVASLGAGTMSENYNRGDITTENSGNGWTTGDVSATTK